MRNQLSRWLRALMISLALVVLAACGDTGVTPSNSKPSSKLPTPELAPTITAIPWRTAAIVITSANANHLTRIGSLLAHTVTVNRVVFSHDSQSLLSQDGSGQALVWDMQTGQKRYALTGTGPILTAFFSADDKQIISVSFDNQIRTWDAATGKQISVLPPDPLGFTVAAYTPDGLLLAAGRNDGLIDVWTGAPTGQPAFHIQGTAGRLVRALAFSADGKLLASISSDNTVRVWDSTTGASKATLNPFKSPPLRSVFSPDGSLLAVALGVELHVFSTATFSEKYTVSQPDLAAQNGMAFSPDNHFIAAGSSGTLVYVWDTVTTNVLARLPGHDSQFSALSWSPDGSLLFTTGLSPQAGAYVWNTQGFRLDAQSYPRGAVSAQGEGIYTGSWSPNGKLLVTANVQGALIVWGIPAG